MVVSEGVVWLGFAGAFWSEMHWMADSVLRVGLIRTRSLIWVSAAELFVVAFLAEDWVVLFWLFK